MSRRPRGFRLLVALVVALLVAMPVAPAAAAEPEVFSRSREIFPDTSATDDQFGQAVAVCGDTAVIGMPYRDGRGRACVFVRQGDEWVFQQGLVAADGAADDYFGQAVAVSGDTILIGARGDDISGQLGAGSAYVFVRSPGGWAYVDKLQAPAPDDSDFFGSEVALSGNTAVVGAPGAGGDRGAVHVFTPTGADWQLRRSLTVAGGDPGDSFGRAVAISGGTLAVGAPNEEGTGMDPDADRGGVYVYTGGGGSWTQQPRMEAFDGADRDMFGASVAVSGDTVLVGAYGDDNAGGVNAGAAYACMLSGSSWSQQKLLAPDRQTGDWFGMSVSISGGALLVGAPYDDTMATDDGSAYLFTRSGSSWTYRTQLIPTDAFESYERLGFSVALSGGNAVMGQPGRDTTLVDAGGAYAATFGTYPSGATRIAGANRYATAAAASRRGFPAGAPAVVIATGANWPDALGGSGLAGAAHGPLLLTRKDAVPSEVTAEITRLGAVKTYVLGSTASVSTAVENALVSMLGRANVVRLGGSNRYETARKVADETIRLQGAEYPGYVFVTTGANFPDATAASPHAAHKCAPILLVNPTNGTYYLPSAAYKAYILGSTASVSASVEASLKTKLAPDRVYRVGGANRYATAAMVAQSGIGLGLQWNGVGLATGENFPDALSAGPMLATTSSVLLLTRPTVLIPDAQAKLAANAAAIDSMFIFGDYNAVSLAVENAAKAAAGVP